MSPDNPWHAELGRRLSWFDPEDPQTTNEHVGRRCREVIHELLPGDWTFEGKRMLDFGCGVGRMLRHFRAEAERAEIHGCDIHAPSIEWLSSHCAPPFHVSVNDPRPPLEYASGYFDLITAVSVFTHLTETWSEWLLELHRILAPDGLLIATFSGSGMAHILEAEPWNQKWDEDRIGMNVLLPHPWDVGGPAVFHSRWWIESHWGRAFDILELRPDGLAFVESTGQGQVLMRKRDVELDRADFEAPEPGDPREYEALKNNIAALTEELELKEQRAVAAERRADDLAHGYTDAVDHFERAQDAYRALRAAYDEKERDAAAAHAALAEVRPRPRRRFRRMAS